MILLNEDRNNVDLVIMDSSRKNEHGILAVNTLG